MFDRATPRVALMQRAIHDPRGLQCLTGRLVSDARWVGRSREKRVVLNVSSLRSRAVLTATLSGGAVLLALLLSASTAYAGQPRDWMIAAQPEGTDAMVDLVFPGVQATLEHRVPVYSLANQLTLRGNALYTVPFVESQADLELRILVLTLGASGGFRHDMHALEFEPDEAIDRHSRRLKDVDGDVTSMTYEYGEGRATISLPINDHVLLNAINTMRWQGSPDRTFDWRSGVVHDGMLFRSDIFLFFKHRDLGGFAPVWQILNFGLDDRRFTQFNYGFALVTRPGFVRRNDIFLLQMLFNVGSTFGGYDNVDGYGAHLFFAPMTFLLAYRVVLPVWRPDMNVREP